MAGRAMWKKMKACCRAKKDDFESVATDLENRATKLKGRSDAVGSGNDEVVFAIAQFVRVLGRANRAATVLTLTIAGLTILSIGMAIKQTKDAEKFSQIQNNIALNSKFYDSQTYPIREAIEYGGPILTKNNGIMKEPALANYLGDFETIDAAYEDGALSEQDLCSSFSFFITETHKNREVMNYIVSQRKENTGYFVGLDELNEIVSKSKNPSCH